MIKKFIQAYLRTYTHPRKKEPKILGKKEPYVATIEKVLIDFGGHGDIRPAPFEQQDRLKGGLLKIAGAKEDVKKHSKNGYVEISKYGERYQFSDGTCTMSPFAKRNQDRLDEGLIKFDKRWLQKSSYKHIDDLDRLGLCECFIATAVYGDINSSEVQTLREFRDNYLTHSSLGKAFVKFYYSGAGEKTADFIKEHLPSTIPVIRKGLDVLVNRYSTQQRKVQ